MFFKKNKISNFRHSVYPPGLQVTGHENTTFTHILTKNQQLSTQIHETGIALSTAILQNKILKLNNLGDQIYFFLHA